MPAARRKALLLSLLASLLGLVAVEAWQRDVLCQQAGESRFDRVRERFLANPLSIESKHHVRAPPIWAKRAADPGQGVNENGFRGPAVATDKPAGTLRVVCLGGSSVYGTANSSWGAAWPARLQQLLDKDKDRQAEVLNGGVPGYQAHQSLERFERMFVPLAPDVAILCNTYNDVIASRAQRIGFYATDEAVDALDGALPTLLSRSALGLRWLAGRVVTGSVWAENERAERARVEHLKLVSPDVQDREARHVARQPAEIARRAWLDRCVFAQDLADYARTVERFVDAAQRAGSTPVLCLEPLAVAPGDDEDAWSARGGGLTRFFPSGAIFSEVYLQHGAVLRDVAARRGVLFIDAHGQWSRPEGTFAGDDPVHFGDRGAFEFARYLKQQLGDLDPGPAGPQ